MPNLCGNQVVFLGKAPDVIEAYSFLKSCERDDQSNGSGSPELDFKLILPEPEDLPSINDTVSSSMRNRLIKRYGFWNSYEWRIRNGGRNGISRLFRERLQRPGKKGKTGRRTSALYFTNHSTALYCKGPDLKQVRAPSFLIHRACDFLTIRSWTMNENKNDVPAADDGRILVGYLTCLIDGSPKDPIPVYVNKDGEPLPGWFKMRVSGVIEADGRYRAYDDKPRFDAVDIKDAIKPENASKPE